MALVLCVDDDPSVARLVADVVEFCRHTAVIETNSLDAVTKWVQDYRIAAVLSDLMMPRLDGLELLTVFQQRQPTVRRVLITAAPHEESVREAARDGLVQMVIAKPPAISDIRQALLWL